MLIEAKHDISARISSADSFAKSFAASYNSVTLPQQFASFKEVVSASAVVAAKPSVSSSISYETLCRRGFSGSPTCLVDVNECLSAPCQNSGACAESRTKSGAVLGCQMFRDGPSVHFTLWRAWEQGLGSLSLSTQYPGTRTALNNAQYAHMLAWFEGVG